jgi:hypothetical protein
MNLLAQLLLQLLGGDVKSRKIQSHEAVTGKAFAKDPN